jgi:GNAT superfamily N-acetyltransferase
VIDVRRVTQDQWQQLRDVRLTALRDHPEAFGSTYEREIAFDEPTWRARTQSSAMFFAMHDDEPVGLAACFYDPEDCAPDERLVVSVWVASAHRGQGVVGLLLDEIIKQARDDGATALLLDVALTNDSARKAYLRAGFIPTGHTKPLERDSEILEETMRLPLV